MRRPSSGWPVAEIVADSQACHLRGERPARLVHAEELGHGVAQGLGALVLAAKRDRSQRVAQHAGGDRMALGVVGIEEAVRRRPLDHLGQLPAEIHRILHPGLQPLPAVRRMDVRGIAREQHASLAVGRCLPGRVGEPRDRGGRVDPVVGPVDGDQRLAEIASVGSAAAPTSRSVTMTPTGPSSA